MQHCLDVHCHNADHHYESDDYLNVILQTIKSTAEKCLPSSRGTCDKKKIGIPNWNDEIKPFKEKAMCWHAVWQSAGRPINTVLHRVMKKNQKHLPPIYQEEQKDGRYI